MANKDGYLEFKTALNELKMNSKPLINSLTKIAEEKMFNAVRIVRALEERIFEAPPEYVLPALYALDSIVKNLRSTIYVELVESCLPVLFAHAFNRVDDSTRSSMFKLRQTWPPFFKNLTLYNVDTRINDIDSGWPILARVPDPAPFINPNEKITSKDEQKTALLFFPNTSDDSSTFTTRTVSQPPISVAPPKIADLTTRVELYKTIPEERMEQIRQETALLLDLDADGQKKSKIRKLSEKKKKSNKKRRPSARLRRKAQALAQALQQNRSVSSSDENSNNEEDDQDDEDDEPFIIKKSSTSLNQSNSTSTEDNQQNTENLFGAKDKDYRENETKIDQDIRLDAESIFEINSKCLVLAEKKFKCKEFSVDEYQSALKLLQTILESEVKRLSNYQNNTTSIINGTNLLSPTNSFSNSTTTTNLPFQQQILQLIEQQNNQNNSLNSFNTLTNATSPYHAFANETYRNVMQILTSVGAPASYTSHYNFLSYYQPIASPIGSTNSFPFLTNNLTSNSIDSTNLFSLQQSPPMKRILEENENQNNTNNLHADEEIKRPRYDPVTGRAIRTRDFDDERIALVPSLIDANINMLKKNYFGIAQQLYVGKFQCRMCGLRFTMKQKQDYTRHLDWHYLENKNEKNLSNGTMKMVSRTTRSWYPSVIEWTLYEDTNDELNRTSKPQVTPIINKIENNELLRNGENIISENGLISCPASNNADLDDDRCFVCHDPFENFFDDNREEWHLKNAMRVDGKTYHPICYQDLYGS